MANDWELTRDGPFIPEVGRCYEITFGKDLLHKGKVGEWLFRVRCDDPLNKAKWTDLDTCQPLAPDLWGRVVIAYRKIECTDCP